MKVVRARVSTRTLRARVEGRDGASTAGDRFRQVRPGLRPDRAIAGNGLREVRDRAVIAFGVLSATRPFELVDMRVEDLERRPEGMLVFVRR